MSPAGRRISADYENEARTEVKVICAEVLEGRLEGRGRILLVWVVELGGKENRAAGDTRCSNACADLLLVPVRGSGVDVRVPILQSEFHSVLDLHLYGLH